ncbi:hypothetical protein B0H11DRAFT_2247286 [Mycena galericulata]|nr:hypothetical protein B0H11DRAFT_2247286 [Mycena galericulata]
MTENPSVNHFDYTPSLRPFPLSHYFELSGASSVPGGKRDISRCLWLDGGYWEEYHRRRYEIIYGSDFGEDEEELPETSDEEHRAGGFSGAVDPYDAPDVSGDYASAEMVELEGAEDEVAIWEATWERGPPVGENELEWAVTMDAWRQRIEAGADIDEESGADAVSAYAPAADRGLVRIPPFECAEAPLDVVTVPPTFEELQAACDRGEIPEADREECARLLGELWACELEDQGLLAAGYVWNEELGDYVHATETDLPEEYEREEDDGTSADLVVDGACDVHHLVEASLPSAVPAECPENTPMEVAQPLYGVTAGTPMEWILAEFYLPGRARVTP